MFCTNKQRCFERCICLDLLKPGIERLDGRDDNTSTSQLSVLLYRRLIFDLLKPSIERLVGRDNNTSVSQLSVL